MKVIIAPDEQIDQYVKEVKEFLNFFDISGALYTDESLVIDFYSMDVNMNLTTRLLSIILN